MLSLLQSMVLVVLFAHWSACVWMLQTSFADHLDDTWLVHAKYCIAADDMHAALTSNSTTAPDAREMRQLVAYSATAPAGFDDFVCLPAASIYTAAFCAPRSPHAIGCHATLRPSRPLLAGVGNLRVDRLSHLAAVRGSRSWQPFVAAVRCKLARLSYPPRGSAGPICYVAALAAHRASAPSECAEQVHVRFPAGQIGP